MPAYEGIYVIWGPPGTGKTRRLTNEIQRIVSKVKPREGDASPVAVCSLTRTAAAEIAGRDLPIPRYQVGTLHSFAYRQLNSPDLAEAESADFSREYPQFALTPQVDVDDVTGEVSDSQGTYPGNDQYRKYSKYRSEMRPRDSWEPDVKYFAKCWEEWKKKSFLVDFCDMIDMAITDGHGCAPGNPSVLVVDEAQDVSKQEWQLLRVWYEAAGALMVAGDAHQSLFRWRGSDDSIFYDPAIRNDHKRILHQSFRVPRLVRDLSVRWLEQNLSNYIELNYRPTQEDGFLGRFVSTIDTPHDVVNYVKSKNALGESVMLATSCGYMLRPIIKALREEGVTYSNPWRRKRTDWNPLGGSSRGHAAHDLIAMLHGVVKGTRRITFSDLKALANLFRVDGVLKYGVKASLKEIAGKVGKHVCDPSDVANIFDPESWKSLCESIENDPSGKRYGAWLDARRRPQRAKVIKYATRVIHNGGIDALTREPLCHTGTIHSYKGAEADHVVLFPDLSMAADMAYRGAKTVEDRDNVIRTFYVGMTRARKSLCICHPKSWLRVDIPLTA